MACYPERRKGRLTGVWIAEALVRGKRFRSRHGTQAEGERWADTISTTGLAPVVEEGPKPITWGEMAEEAKATKPSWRSGRDASVIQRLEYVTEAVGAFTPLGEVSTKVLDKLVSGLARRPGKQGGKLSSGTINRYLTAASAVLTFAVERGHLPACPTIPWQKEGGRRLHWVSEPVEDELASYMLASGEHGCALALRVLTASGLRWGEFSALEPGQVDILNSGAWIRLWKTKTDTPRSVPIDMELARNLKALAAAGGLPDYYTFRKVLKAAYESAGQSPELCVHSLRHTTATRLVQRNVPLPVVQRFLGHKTIVTTMRYAHVADEDLLQASRKLSPLAGQIALAPEEATG